MELSILVLKYHAFGLLWVDFLRKNAQNPKGENGPIICSRIINTFTTFD